MRDLKKVSRVWKDVVESSSAVSRATRLRPNLAADPCCKDRGTPLSNSMFRVVRSVLINCFKPVCYPPEAWIRLNPALRAVSELDKRMLRLVRGYRTRINVLLSDTLEEEPGLMEQYVTEPPVCAISLQIKHRRARCNSSGLMWTYWNTNLGEENRVTAYSRSGLKIKDLMAVRFELQKAQRSYLQMPSPSGTSVIASFWVQDQDDSGDETRTWGNAGFKSHQNSPELAYFEGDLPRFRGMIHASEEDREAAAEKDAELALTPETLRESTLEECF